MAAVPLIAAILSRPPLADLSDPIVKVPPPAARCKSSPTVFVVQACSFRAVSPPAPLGTHRKITMRAARITWGILAALGLVHGVAATLAPRQASEPTTSGNTTSTTAQAAPVDPQVAFLQTLQAAQVSSMSCLITLVNMTVSPIGTCLGLTTLADLIARPADNASFSTQLTGYLSAVCASGQCTDGDISQTRAQLADTCANSGDTQLVTVLRAVLDNYTNSYRTLACSVYL